jgi:uncharacterized protein with PIN domain
MHTEKNTRIPIARCPSCRHSLLYARDPRKKKDITVRIAEPDFDGKTMLCAKCKTMLAVIEKPAVAAGYVAVPILDSRERDHV